MHSVTVAVSGYSRDMDGITFIGTATTLIRLGSFTVLGLDRTTPVVTTTAAQRRLRQWGFEATGLETWQTHELSQGDERLTVTSLPGVHARGLLGKLLPPVMGSLLEHRVGEEVVRRVYLTGDTLTGAHLDTIHARHPDIDVAVVHLGGTRVLFHTVTMDAEQGVDLLRRVDPDAVVPVHYDDYGVFRSPLSDFTAAAQRSGFAARIMAPARGETVSFAPRAAGG